MCPWPPLAMKREEGGQIFMEKGRELTEGREEIEEERIDGDEEKSTSLPWGMNGKNHSRGLLAADQSLQIMSESAENMIFSARFLSDSSNLKPLFLMK